MNHERALLLAEALESGLYVQGFGALELRPETGGIPVSNCCLGVATRVAQLQGVRMQEAIDRDYVVFDGNSTSMNDAVEEWFGFQDRSGAFGFGNEGCQVEGFSSLMEMNDSKQYTFADIARVIRENWELL